MALKQSTLWYFSETKLKQKKEKKMKVRIHANFDLEKLIQTQKQNQLVQTRLIWMKMVGGFFCSVRPLSSVDFNMAL